MNINNETFLKAFNCLREANIMLENGLGNFNELGVGPLSLIKKMNVKNGDRLDFLNGECSKLGNYMYNTIQILSKIDQEAAFYFNDILTSDFVDEFGDFSATINEGNLKPKNNSDIAHRGLGGKENTMEAFINSGKAGEWGCEADIRFDQDGNLVCSHDTVDGSEKPTSFEEYLDICKEYGMTAIIDLKYAKGVGPADPYLSPAILKVIEEKGMIDSCVIQTNNPTDIPYIRETSSSARIWYLTDVISDKNLELIRNNGVECVNMQNGENTSSGIKKLVDNDIDVCVWNVQTEQGKDRYLKYGAKYIMSDNVLGITPYQTGEENFNNL